MGGRKMRARKRYFKPGTGCIIKRLRTPRVTSSRLKSQPLNFDMYLCQIILFFKISYLLMDPDPFDAICSCKFHNHGFSVERHQTETFFLYSVEQIICVHPGWFSQKIQYFRLLQLSEIGVLHKILQHADSVRIIETIFETPFFSIKRFRSGFWNFFRSKN